MATQPLSNHDELVAVFDSMEESEVMVVRGLLESAGIECLVSALDAPQDVLPGVGGLVVRVPSDRAGEARELIEQERRAAGSEDSDLELSDSDTPDIEA